MVKIISKVPTWKESAFHSYYLRQQTFISSLSFQFGLDPIVNYFNCSHHHPQFPKDIYYPSHPFSRPPAMNQSILYLLDSCLWVSEKCSRKLHNHADGAITSAYIPNSAESLMVLSNSFLLIHSRVPFSVLYGFCKPLFLFSIPHLILVPHLSRWCFHLYSDHPGQQVSISSVFHLSLLKLNILSFIP